MVTDRRYDINALVGGIFNASTRIVDDKGRATPIMFRLLERVWQRTGGPEDQLFDLVNGNSSGTPLAIFAAGLNTSGKTTLNFISDAGNLAGLDAGNGLTIDVANDELDADVLSVFGRTGAITAQSGDYDADQVTFDTSGNNLTSVDVQAAIEEVNAKFTTGGITDAIVDGDFTTTGLMAKTGATAYAARTLQAGDVISLTDPGGTTTDPTIAVDVNGLGELTSPDTTADFFLVYDASSSNHKKITLENFDKRVDINALTETTAVDTTSDFLVFYDADAGVNKKVTPSNAGFIGNQETIDRAKLTVDNEGTGGSEYYNITWAVGSEVSDSSHDLRISLFRLGDYIARVDITSPASVLSTTYTSTTGGSNNTEHRAVFMLRNTSGETIYTQVSDVDSVFLEFLLLESGDKLLQESGDGILIEGGSSSTGAGGGGAGSNLEQLQRDWLDL